MTTLMMTFATLLLFLAQGAFAVNAQTKPSIDKNKALGNPSAPMTVEFFCDFENEHCRTIYTDWVPRLMKDFVNNGKMYVVFREYPLQSHPYARVTAIYAVAAARVGKYSQVASALCENQQSWALSGKVWETVATALTPAEQKKVQALAKDQGVLGEVEGDVQRARAMGISQVPSMIITHKAKELPMITWNDYKSFAAYINGLLKY